MRNLQIQLREHRVNTVEETFPQITPIERRKQILSRFVNIVINTDTLQVSVAKKCNMNNYGKCGVISLPKRMLLPYGTTELAISTVDPNTIKIRTVFLTWTMEAVQLLKFYYKKRSVVK